MTPEQKTKIIKNERGIALITALLFLMVLTILGTTAIVISSTDIQIGGNYKLSKQAFYNAEAGIQYAIKNIENGLAAETLSLTGSSVAVNYTAPAGFSFDPITNLAQVGGTGNYSFRATGHSANSAKATIEVVIKQEPVFNYGVFGDDMVDLKASGCVYSYNSETTPNPLPSDSTGEADVGSNVAVQTYMSTYVDGDVALGDDGLGTEGVYIPSGVPIITGTAGVDVDRVDPDPLGAVSGDLASTFSTVSSGSNDNAWGGITGDTINLGTGNTMILYGKAGGANYYVTDINLNNGATLNIDATAGPVNIYLAGGLDAKNGSAINITGAPPDFTIYSNSTDSIVFRHGGTFKGTVYAPYAPVEMKNSSDVYGLIWANTSDIKNTGEFYFDTALKDKYLSDNVSILSWREVR
ncbi:MAG: pilus assembly PilX N-terminal domain-containing protein [Desulfovibrionales bacterium]|nr:pilus assembly PilX N-terminal domain-containing protein [Desulfovibrionales bacterium]